MNWSHLAHLIGDMRNGEEYNPVMVLFPDGKTVEVKLGLVQTSDGPAIELKEE